jgi:glutamine cyclotransferase
MSKSRDIADSAATINYIDGLTSDAQSQINTVQSEIDNFDPLPSQSGQSGKYLSTNGTTASWETLTTDPTLGTLTKTFTTGESSTINLSSSVLAPVVSVTKEVPQTGVTNNNWDVNSTTENYTRLDSAAATTLDWVGDFSQTSYSTKSVSVSAQDGTPLGLTFKPDGTKMYMVGNGSDSVNEYNLSTAFDVSTATYSQNFSVAAQDTVPAGVAFNLDGSKMFITGGQNDSAYEYSLSTAYDVSTASYVRSFNTSSQDTDARSITFNLDGTKMFLGGNSSASVLEYNLSTGFDLSTASYSQSFSFSSQSSGCGGIAFNYNGTELYVSSGDAAGSWVYKYNLSTGFDVSTASYSSVSLNASSQDANPFGIAFNRNGSLLFVLGLTNKTIYQYSMPTSLALGTGSFASADVGKTIEANSGVFVLTATDGSFVETTAPTSYDQVASGDWSMYGVVYNAADGDLELSGTIVIHLTYPLQFTHRVFL